MASINDFIASKKVILDTGPSGANISTPCLSFPILIEISASVLGWDSKSITAFFGGLGNNGKRIQFYEPGRVIPLSYECELFDPAAQIARYWVKTDMLAQALNHVWVAFGNDPNGTDQDNPSDVWSNGFGGVWHLSETSGNQIDSKNGLVATPKGSVTQDVAGYVGKGDLFNNPVDYQPPSILTVPHNVALETPTQLTLSGWIKVPNGKSHTLIQKGIFNTNIDYRLIISGATNKGRFAFDNGGVRKTIDTVNNFPNDIWTHYSVAVIENGANLDINLYYNGALDKSGTITNSSLDQHGTEVCIGGLDGSSSLATNGYMDEIRISTVQRAADWVKLEYYSMFVANGFHGGKYMTWDSTIWNTELLEN